MPQAVTDRFVIFTLEDIPAQSETAGALGTRMLVGVEVRIHTLLPMLRIIQELVCVFEMGKAGGRTLQVI